MASSASNRQIASRVGLLYRVAARFVAKEEAPPLAKGDVLVIWMKKGDWWTEIKRGVKLEVKDVQGDKIKVHHAGWANGDGWEMKLAPDQDLSGKFKLEGDARFRRALVVTRQK